MSIRFGVLAPVLALFVSVAPAAPRQDPPEGPLADGLHLGVGTFITDFETEAAVGGGGLVGTSFTAEDALDIDDEQSVFRLDGFYRFNERHAIGLGYWDLDRSGSVVLDETIIFNGTEYGVGATVDSQFDTSWLRFDYRYSALRSKRGEAGFMAGLSFYEFSMGLTGEATVSDGMGGTVVVSGTREEDDLLAPVPTYGVFFNFAAHPRVVIGAEATYLDLSIDDLGGKVTDTRFTVDWLFTRHVGLGVGTFKTEINVDDQSDDPYRVNWDQSGLMLYVKLAFL